MTHVSQYLDKSSHARCFLVKSREKFSIIHFLLKFREMFSDIAVKGQDDYCKNEITRLALIKLRMLVTDDSSRECRKKIIRQKILPRTPSKLRRINFLKSLHVISFINFNSRRRNPNVDRLLIKYIAIGDSED